jgi:hypothetical protein
MMNDTIVNDTIVCETFWPLVLRNQFRQLLQTKEAIHDAMMSDTIVNDSIVNDSIVNDAATAGPT